MKLCPRCKRPMLMSEQDETHCKRCRQELYFKSKKTVNQERLDDE